MSESSVRCDPRLPPVLFLGDHFGYAGGVAHGATTYFVNVLPALAHAGVRVTPCFLRSPHVAADILRGSGVEPRFLSARSWDPFVVFRVAALARREGCGMIHAAGLKGSLVGRAVSRMLGLPLLIHVHDLNYPDPVSRRVHRLLRSPHDLAICVSHASGVVAEEGYEVPRANVRVVYNGVQLDAIRRQLPGARERVRAALQIGAVPVLAMVGRFYWMKGQAGRVRMLPAIVARVPDVVLLMVGDGPDRAACEALAQQLGVSGHVRFLGHREDVPVLLAASDLVAMPSIKEGLGLAAIEALACEKPVIAFGVGGLPEVIADGVDGLVIAPGDEVAFAAAAAELLLDPARRAVLGARGAQNAERFSLPRHIAQLLECYHEAAGLAAPRPVTV